jgi:hypothetical protein
MMNLANLRRRLAQSFGIAAAAALMMSAAQRAEALTPVHPGASPIAKIASDALITEVRGGHGGGGHGGGGGFHGGGFHGGPAFHGGGGGFRSGGAVFHGAGMRAFHGGGFHHHGGARFIFARHHHHHFGRGFYGYGYEYYPTYYYDYPRRCRTIWTYYGPRRICHYHRWHHYWHHRHHHRRHHHWRVY